MLNRIDVQNDPVNFIDPNGLKLSDFPGDVVTAFKGATKDALPAFKEAAKDVKPALKGAANSITDIAVNGPVEAQVLLASAVVIEGGLAAETFTMASLTNPVAYGKFLEFASSVSPGTAPVWSMYGAAGSASFQSLAHLWELFSDWWKREECP